MGRQGTAHIVDRGAVIDLKRDPAGGIEVPVNAEQT
jgi:hypothetical protein